MPVEIVKYEYHVFVADRQFSPKDMQRILNQYGQEGWLCTAILKQPNGDLLVFMARPISEKPDDSQP